MSKFIVKSKRKRGVIRQEAHVWLKAIERGVVYHEVNDILWMRATWHAIRTRTLRSTAGKCFSHKQALAATPVPDEWVDPRLLDNADATLELHELPRAVVAWRDRVYTILRTIDDAGMARMGKIAAESHDVMEDYEWWDRENAVWTAEKAHAHILEWYVIEDFRNFGLWPCFNSYNMGYALSIKGWANFNFVRTHDTRMFNANMADNGAGNYC